MGKNLKATFSLLAATIMVLAAMLIPEACSSQVSAQTVEMYRLQYLPAALTVKVGTAVTWKNTESNVHSVTSDTGLFDSGLFSPGDSYTYTFLSTGTYYYHCKIQGGMTGTIFVK
ncbi:cupredoxin domain-containing protein [Dehalogenimonas etheniformans]|nr:plastocyanin/azurin family copper-binding protein [Dehalogenimonas etheniformans]